MFVLVSLMLLLAVLRSGPFEVQTDGHFPVRGCGEDPLGCPLEPQGRGPMALCEHVQPQTQSTQVRPL